jgi:hypothetical protein
MPTRPLFTQQQTFDERAYMSEICQKRVWQISAAQIKSPPKAALKFKPDELQVAINAGFAFRR